MDRPGAGNVMKVNGRRKKGRRHARPPARPRQSSSWATQPAPAPWIESRASHLSKSLGRFDWTAFAILVVPLAIMALIPSRPSEPTRRVTEPAAWHGDLSREAMPLLPDPTSRVARAPIELPSLPWHGDLKIEAMPLTPGPASRVADTAPIEPPPVPWHGDLTIEAMPVLPDATSRVAHAALPPPAMCVSEAPLALASAQPSTSFGHAVSDAARAQTNGFVIYNARYISIAYPGGDTKPLYGVCTDIVIRAYRALGIDLQELIHVSRLGRGDPSIDHRRVEVVRRFLARYGTSLDISEFAEDYRPGDIVTYHRPEGRISQYHIAIVTDRIAPSGRPLIAHNRGWGPQVEDALFADRITGHYRLSPEQVGAFQRSRAPPVSERRRHTADIAATTRRR